MKLLETRFPAQLRRGDGGDVIGDGSGRRRIPFQESQGAASSRQAADAGLTRWLHTSVSRTSGRARPRPGTELQQLERQILIHDARLPSPVVRPSTSIGQTRPGIFPLSPPSSSAATMSLRRCPTYSLPGGSS
jgi:hypothetical protein